MDDEYKIDDNSKREKELFLLGKWKFSKIT